MSPTTKTRVFWDVTKGTMFMDYTASYSRKVKSGNSLQVKYLLQTKSNAGIQQISVHFMYTVGHRCVRSRTPGVPVLCQTVPNANPASLYLLEINFIVIVLCLEGFKRK